MGRTAGLRLGSRIAPLVLLAGVASACATPASRASLTASAHRSTGLARPVAAPEVDRGTATCEATTLHWRVVDGPRTLTVSLDAQAIPAPLAAAAEGHLDLAIDEWNAVGLPVRLQRASGARRADIQLAMVERLPAGDDASPWRAGTTQLVHDERGVIARAAIVLAIRTSGGAPLGDTDRAAMMLHELGHALGLPHAADSRSLMSPQPLVASITRRDERGARARYADAAACIEARRLASRNDEE